MSGKSRTDVPNSHAKSEVKKRRMYFGNSRERKTAFHVKNGECVVTRSSNGATHGVRYNGGVAEL